MCEKVIPVFIFTPEQIGSQNKYRSSHSIQFMIESLDDLKHQLRSKRGDLYALQGENNKIIEHLIKSTNADSLFVNMDYTPYSKKKG